VQPSPPMQRDVILSRFDDAYMHYAEKGCKLRHEVANGADSPF